MGQRGHLTCPKGFTGEWEQQKSRSNQCATGCLSTRAHGRSGLLRPEAPKKAGLSRRRAARKKGSDGQPKRWQSHRRAREAGKSTAPGEHVRFNTNARKCGHGQRLTNSEGQNIQTPAQGLWVTSDPSWKEEEEKINKAKQESPRSLVSKTEPSPNSWAKDQTC